ncbi:DsrE/DsrF/DrsH-like family protein [Propionibacteriaceae bacterium G1746]
MTTTAIPEGFVMPDFGDTRTTPAGVGGTQTHAASEATSQVAARPRKIAFICSKGNLDMAYPALIMGNAALTEGCEVHIFFTFWGLDIINSKTNRKLRFTMAGNTAMHLPDLGRLRPGLEHVSIPQSLGNVPGATAFGTQMMKKMMADEGVPDVPEFLDLMHDMGAHMYACKLTFDMMKLIEADMHPGVEGVISAADFIEISAGAQVIFV